MTGDRWHVTVYRWQVTGDRCIFSFLSFINFLVSVLLSTNIQRFLKFWINLVKHNFSDQWMKTVSNTGDNSASQNCGKSSINLLPWYKMKQEENRVSGLLPAHKKCIHFQPMHPSGAKNEDKGIFINHNTNFLRWLSPPPPNLPSSPPWHSWLICPLS